MDKINIFNKNIEEMSPSKYVLVMGLIGFFLSVLFSNIVYYIFGVDTAAEYHKSKDPILVTILSGIIIAPFIETLIFQYIPLSLLKPYNMKLSLKILISAFCFGMVHIVYSGFYAVSSFVIGVILAYSFILYESKNQNPILVVTLVHGLINLLALISSKI